MPWHYETSVHGLISRYYAQVAKGIPPKRIEIAGEALYAFTREDREDALVQRHTEATASWILKRASEGAPSIRAFCSPEELKFFPGSPYERYLVFTWNGQFPDQSPGKGYEARPLGTHDRPALEALFSGWDIKMLHPGQFDYMRFIRDHAFGAFHQGQLVAARGIFDRTADEIEVGRAFTAQEFRGKGLQPALLATQLRQIAKVESGCRIISLVAPENQAPQRVLRSANFEVTAELCILDIN